MRTDQLTEVIHVPLSCDNGDESGQYTEEGYYRDTPIVTRVGVFKYYDKEKGGWRREFRPPEEVFSKESLESYKGKPIILTHAGGRIDTENVMDEEVGVVLSEGIQDGDYVRADIIIHDVQSALVDNKTRELSLGYNRELEDKPGVYNGEPYDGIQRNIRINHLAIVENARAGRKAKLNVDSDDDIEAIEISDEGGNSMKRNNSEAISPEELQKRIDGFVAKNGSANEAKLEADGDAPEAEAAEAIETPKPEETAAVPEAEENTDAKDSEAGEELKDPKALTPAEIIQAVREKHDCKDGDDPADLEAAQKLLKEKDDQITKLLDAIGAMEAEKVPAADAEETEVTPVPVQPEAKAAEDCKTTKDCGTTKDCNTTKDCGTAKDCNTAKDCAGVAGKKDSADMPVEKPVEKAVAKPAEEADEDDDDEDYGGMNADAVMRRVNERVAVIRMGDKLNIELPERASIIEMKKEIIKKCDPKMSFDGKSKGFVNAAYEFVCHKFGDMKKDTNYQRAQMRGFAMNMDSANSPVNRRTADQARQEMINSMDHRKDDKGGNE